MRSAMLLLQAAALAVAATLTMTSGCGGKLADDGSVGEVDGAIDSPSPAPATCSKDSDCVDQCGTGHLCCCDSPSSTCFSPESGECGGSDSTPADASSGNPFI